MTSTGIDDATLFRLGLRIVRDRSRRRANIGSAALALLLAAFVLTDSPGGSALLAAAIISTAARVAHNSKMAHDATRLSDGTAPERLAEILARLARRLP